MLTNAIFLSFSFGVFTHAFTLYPSMNATSFGKSLGVDSTCLMALNATVNCDQSKFAMASSPDSYQWANDDLTTLCTSDCTDAVKQWNDNVASQCQNQQINVNGAMVPVDTVSGRYSEGYNIACLKSSNSSFCFLESQEWVGSDVIQSNCTNATDPSCNPNNPSNSRMANLYDDTTLCSDCFVKMMHQRLASPYLPDTDHSDYLVEQFQDIQDVCTTSMPALTTRAPPNYTPVPSSTASPASATASGAPFSTANGTFTNSSQPVCDGQTIQDGTFQKRAVPYQGGRLPFPFKRSPTLAARDLPQNSTMNNTTTCDTLSLKYGITTGDLQDASGTDDCSQTCDLCVPARCNLLRVPQGMSCDTVAESITTSTFNVTTYQFLLWNPNIIGLCDSLQEGQYVCTGPPGGTYSPIGSPLGNSSDASSQARGGPGGDGSVPSASNSTPTPSNPTPTSLASTSAALEGGPITAIATAPSVTSSGSSSTPSATQSGIASNCTKYQQAKTGDYCEKFAQNNSIRPNTLYKLNPILGDQGQGCDKNFFANYFYCVAA